MTIPSERANSIVFARSVLISLLSDDTGVDVLSDDTKSLIRAALRHYPSDFYIRELALKCPDILYMRDE